MQSELEDLKSRINERSIKEIVEKLENYIKATQIIR